MKWLNYSNSKERISLYALLALTIFGTGYGMTKANQKPAPINFDQAVASAPVEKPGTNEVVVHVVGAVKKPGLYHLPATARIDDALKAAGNAYPDADLESLNLAAKVVDGSQIHVPRRLEANRSTGSPRPNQLSGTLPLRVEMPPEYRGLSTRRTSSKKAPATGSISVNTASASKLEALPGVGPATARRIVEYRNERGPFSSIDEVVNVKGIGPKKLEAMRPFLRL